MATKQENPKNGNKVQYTFGVPVDQLNRVTAAKSIDIALRSLFSYDLKDREVDWATFFVATQPDPDRDAVMFHVGFGVK